MVFMTAALLAWLVGCAPASADAPCDAQAGMEHDQCVLAQVTTRDAAHVSEVIALSRQIHDPMIRGAAVSSWISHHNTGVSPADGQALCGLLAGRDNALCLRRLSSPHLQR